MLVSSIAKFSAVSLMNNSAFNMMQTSNSLLSNTMNASSFGGEHDLSMLNKMDKKLSLDLNSNKMLYKINYLQEKFANKCEENQCRKPHLSLLA